MLNLIIIVTAFVCWKCTVTPLKQLQLFILFLLRLEKISHVNCSYSDACSCCQCALPSMENDRNVYTVQLCVTNTAGNSTSSTYSYIPQNISECVCVGERGYCHICSVDLIIMLLYVTGLNLSPLSFSLSVS